MGLDVSVRGSLVISSLLLIISILFVYSGVERYGFVTMDYGSCVEPVIDNNIRLDVESLRWIFTESYKYSKIYIPVVFFSVASIFEVFGASSGALHFFNVLMHCLNGVLFALLVYRMTNKISLSFLASFLYCVHPLRVESVVWSVEIKDMLLGFFFLISCHLYLSYVAKNRLFVLVAIFITMALCVLSKPTGLVLPVVFILIDYWPLNRYCRKTYLKIFLEKSHMFLLSISCAIWTYLIAKNMDAVVLDKISITEKISNAAVSYMMYLYKTFYPFDLSIFYVHPKSWSIYTVVFSVMSLLIITLVVIKFSRSKPYLLFGWLWFVLCLVPNSGIVQAGLQSMADRFSYLSHMGIFIALVLLGNDYAKMKYWLYKVMILLCVLVLPAIMLISHARVNLWEDELALYGQALQEDQDNYFVRSVLGFYFAKNNDIVNSVHHLKKALDVSPLYYPARELLIRIYIATGNYQKALELCAEGFILNPDQDEFYFLAADTFIKSGKPFKAIDLMAMQASLINNQSRVQSVVGQAYSSIGKWSESQRAFLKSIEADSDNVDSLNGLGVAAFKIGNFKLAKESFLKASAVDDKDPEPVANLGVLMINQGQPCDAARFFAETICRSPYNKTAWSNLRKASSCEETEKALGNTCLGIY